MKTLDHDEAMELAVALTGAHLQATRSDRTDVAELIVDFYRQVRAAEARIGHEFAATREEIEVRGESPPAERPFQIAVPATPHTRSR